jgi:anthranilate phosphoribosyltransferase
MKATLQNLIQHKTLTQEEAKKILLEIAAEKYANTQVASFLTVFMMRNITPDELTGFRDAFLELCVPLDLSDFNTIDLVGTGGDGKNTFNISTLSALVVAGAGHHVAKHGNYGVSSVSGSSSVMEYFGYQFTNNEEKLKKMMDRVGMVYLHAPMFHPAMKAVGPIRRELGMKTFFNMLGPMMNPSNPQNQMVGVYNLETMRLYSYIYQQSTKNYSIVYALDGYDEISLTDNFRIINKHQDQLMTPEQLGLPRVKQKDLFGGDTVKEAASIFKTILHGDGTEAQNSTIYANAGMAIHTMHPDKTIADCIDQAKQSLLSGKAKKVLEGLIGN